MNHPRVTISILTYTAVNQAKACLASVFQSTLPFKLILTANGNPAAAGIFAQVAKERPETTVLVNEKNEGFIEPNKRAFDLCDTEFFVMLNDDATVPPDWLEKLLAPFAEFPKAALSGPKNDFQSLLPNFHGSKGGPFEYLNGACLCCKTEILRKHGLFDPNLKWAYCDDSDMSLRMREKGYTLHKADFVLRHEVSATSRHVPEVRANAEANHAYARKRWGHYLRVRKMDYPIVVRRNAAFGDVLLTTPIVRALHEKYPLSPIYVETGTPAVYDRHPLVRWCGAKAPKMSDALTFDLNGSYEARPDRHFVLSYAERCGLTSVDDSTDLYPSEKDHEKAAGLIPEGDWVAIHAGPSTWRSKEWPTARFEEVIAALRAGGQKIVLIGNGGAPLGSHLDMRSKTSVHEMAAIIKRCRLFIGLDSFPLHVAEAMRTPAAGLFGVTDPKFIITQRNTTIGVCGTTASFGLRHRVPNSTVVDDRGEAMNSITVGAVLEAATQLLTEGSVPA